MNNMLTSETDMSGAIAISTARGGQRPFKAVKLQKAAGAFELVWKKTWESADAAGAKYPTETGERAVMVAESKGVVFYRIDIPPVRDSQVDSIVKMQAEALLPLPADKMQVCWRADRVVGAMRGVTIAAGKTEG